MSVRVYEMCASVRCAWSGVYGIVCACICVSVVGGVVCMRVSVCVCCM